MVKIIKLDIKNTLINCDSKFFKKLTLTSDIFSMRQ